MERKNRNCKYVGTLGLVKKLIVQASSQTASQFPAETTVFGEQIALRKSNKGGTAESTYQLRIVSLSSFRANQRHFRLFTLLRTKPLTAEPSQLHSSTTQPL